MEQVRRTKQLFSDVFGPCPVEGCPGVDTDSFYNDDHLTADANHLIQAHGWQLLHVGQDTTTDADGNPWQRTTMVLGEPN